MTTPTPTPVRSISLRTRGIQDLLWVLAPLVVGVSVLSAGWRGWSALVVLLLTTLVPTLVVPAVARLKVSAWTAAAMLVLAAIAWSWWVIRSAGDGSVSVVYDAFPRLLTAPFPAPARADLLAPGVLLTVVVGCFVGIRLARPATLGRRHVSPVVAGVLLYAAGLLLTAGLADRHGLGALALVVVTVAGWVATPDTLTSRRQSDSTPGELARSRSSRSHGLGRALPVLLVVGAVALAAAAPGRSDTFDPRELVTPPHQDIQALSPLPQLAAWGRDPQTELFRVSGDTYPLHLATLTDYDGVSWTAPSRYQSLGGTDEPALPGGPRSSLIRVDVDHLVVDGPWVPAPGRPQEVSDPTAVVDAETGSLVIADRPTTGASYSVAGRVDAPDTTTLEQAAVPTRDQPGVARYLAVPDLPTALVDYAASVTRDAVSPLDRAVAIEGAVRGSRTVSAKAPTGSSYRRIQAFLFDPTTTPDGQAGTSEQFASAFAVLARASGLPTRLVAGFLPGAPAADGPGDERVVRGKDALAWPEVYFAGVGWVPFSPTPDTGLFGPDLRDRTPVGSKPTTSAPPVATATGGAAAGPVVTVEVPATSAGVPTGVVVGGGAVVLLLVVLCLLYGARRARRTRHREAGAMGAWAQLVDVARLRGDDLGPGRSALDVAVRLDTPSRGEPDVVGGGRGPAVRVAEAAERAAFAPPGTDPSGAPRRTTRHGGDPVWRDVEAVERAVRSGVSGWRRMTWTVDPRPLRPRRSRPEVPDRRNVPPTPSWTATGTVGDDADVAPQERPDPAWGRR